MCSTLCLLAEGFIYTSLIQLAPTAQPQETCSTTVAWCRLVAMTVVMVPVVAIMMVVVLVVVIAVVMVVMVAVVMMLTVVLE